MNKFWKILFGLLILIGITVWLVFFFYPVKDLEIVNCDVGQGDATLAIYGKTQVLFDGGPDDSVIDCLDNYLPFWDRDIEAVVLSHPQKDHYGGLIDVFKSYHVETFVSTSLDSSSQEYQVLKNMVGGSGSRVINPTSGMVIRLGTIYLDIVHPSDEFLMTKAFQKEGKLSTFPLGNLSSRKDPNIFSVVAILRFKDFKALLTGDIDPEVSDLISKNSLVESVDYIKVPHHGSKNGISQKLIDVARPQIAVISVGENNSYGHPSEEILKMLKKAGTIVKRTDKEGDVVIFTDGEKMYVK